MFEVISYCPPTLLLVFTLVDLANYLIVELVYAGFLLIIPLLAAAVIIYFGY